MSNEGALPEAGEQLHDLMNEIVTAFSYYRGKATQLQAREERREQRDKRRKDT